MKTAGATAEEAEANARLVVWVVNRIPELVTALEKMRAAFDPYDPTEEEAEACDFADDVLACVAKERKP